MGQSQTVKAKQRRRRRYLKRVKQRIAEAIAVAKKRKNVAPRVETTAD